MSANEDLQSAAIRHAVHNGRYGRGLAAKIVALLDAADGDMVGTLADRLARVQAKGFDTGPATTQRLRDIIEALTKINTEVYDRVAKGLTVELEGFAVVEAGVQAKALENAVSIDYRAKAPTPTYLKTLVEHTPVDGHLLSSWTGAMSANRLARVEQALRIGMVQGETIDQLVRRIRGTKAQGFNDGVLSISRRSAETLAITSVSTIANASRLAVYRENDGLIKGVQFTSTLDTRTSPQCQQHDGEFYPLDKITASPPLHPRCRSVLVPVTKSWDELGIKKDEASEGVRASMTGQVPASTTYGDWLKKQPKSVQDEVLGAERAELFRQGKVGFKDLYRDNGTYRSLEELRAKASASPVGATKAPDRPVTPPKPAAAPVKPLTKAEAFQSPINPAVTDATVKVVPRKQAIAQMEQSVKEGAIHPAYPRIREFKGVKPEQWGKVAFGTSLTDEAASMIAAIQPELDAMAAAFGIPKLRGYKMLSSNASATASMGDGMMNINASMFNRFAAAIGGRDNALELAAAEKKKDALRADLDALKAKLASIREQRTDLTKTADERLELSVLHREIIEQYNQTVKDYNKAHDAAFRANSANVVSDWKAGDDVKQRPYVTTDYYSGIDKARSVLYHEFGHHVHQMTKKVGHRNAYLDGKRIGDPPIEKELRALYSQRFHSVSAESRKARDDQTSTYALKNEHEWFAENFAQYTMGRKDTVDPVLVKLIERLLNEQGN